MIAAVSSNCFMSGKSGSEAGGGGGDDDSCCVRRASTWGKGGQRKGGTEERGTSGQGEEGKRGRKDKEYLHRTCECEGFQEQFMVLLP